MRPFHNELQSGQDIRYNLANEVIHQFLIRTRAHVIISVIPFAMTMLFKLISSLPSLCATVL